MMLSTKVVKGFLLAGFTVLVAGAAFAFSSPDQEYTETIKVKEGAFQSDKEGNVTASVESISGKRIEASPEQVIIFDVPVMGASVDLLLQNLERIRAAGYKNAYLILDSPGGSVLDGGRAIAYMKTSKLNVITVCAGLCASMAAQIHQQGKQRLMYPKSTLMFHQAFGGLSGSLEQMMQQLKWITAYVDRLDLEVVSRTKMSYTEFKAAVGNELWIEAPDALAKGFSDGLVYVSQDSLLPEQSIRAQGSKLQMRFEVPILDKRRHTFIY